MLRPGAHGKEGVSWQVRKLASNTVTGDSGDSGDSNPSYPTREATEKGKSQEHSHDSHTVTKPHRQGAFDDMLE